MHSTAETKIFADIELERATVDTKDNMAVRRWDIFKRNHSREINENVCIQTNVLWQNIPEQIETNVDNLKCVCVRAYVCVCVYVSIYMYVYIPPKLVEQNLKVLT